MSTHTRPHMYVQNVPVYAGTTRTRVATCARGAGTHWYVLNVHMGTCLSGHTGGRGVFIGKTSVFDICFASQPANFRVTKICPRISLDPSGSPKETIGSCPFFVQSLNAPLLPVAMYSSYEARKNTLQTICSATFAPFTPHHPTPPPTAPHNKKTKTHTKTHM